MATTTVAAPRVQTAESSARRSTSAAVRDNRFRNLQLILFAAGAVMMPLGLVVIGLGWYGTAHSHYDYDQRTYLISGGIMGLAITFFGGFLYFGAWLAKVAADQRDSSRQLAESLLALAEVVSRQSSTTVAGADVATDVRAALVLAGTGTTVHRRDCPLVAHRDDLHPLTGEEAGLSACRVCKPDFPDS